MQNKIDIKTFLLNNQIDFLILKNTNEFFSEYLPQKQQFIKAISGFSGSNATIIFTKYKNYFFTDGRYLLQAKQQLNKAIFEIVDTSVWQWLQQHCQDKQKIAMVDSFVSIDEWQKYNQINKNIILIDKKAIDPLEHFWSNTEISDIFTCADDICGATSWQKRQKIIEQHPNKTFFISSSENICWLLNLRGKDLLNTPIFFCFAILQPDKQVILFANIDNKKQLLLKKQKIKVVPLNEMTAFLNLFSTNNNQIYSDFSTTNCNIYNILLKNNFIIYKQNCPITIAKAIKNPAEIAGAIKSCYQDGIALNKFLYWLQTKFNKKESISEFTAQQYLAFLRRQSPDFFYESFDAISAFAENGAIIHYKCNPNTNLLMKSNSLYLIDSGGQYLGNDFYGTTDITRTIAIDKPSDAMILHYTLVLKGHIALARSKFPKGTTGSNIDALARFYLWQFGLDYAHGTGHGIGSFLSVHEGPCAISKNNQQPLLPGMILSNEPGFYLGNNYGIRLENMILVKEYNEDFLCFETISLAPFDFNLIDTKMLTYPEKKWLNDYHQLILQKIGNNLDEKEQEWLKNILSQFKSLT